MVPDKMTELTHKTNWLWKTKLHQAECLLMVRVVVSSFWMIINELF